jgi:hypothetical protein
MDFTSYGIMESFSKFGLCLYNTHVENACRVTNERRSSLQDPAQAAQVIRLTDNCAGITQVI